MGPLKVRKKGKEKKILKALKVLKSQMERRKKGKRPAQKLTQKNLLKHNKSILENDQFAFSISFPSDVFDTTLAPADSEKSFAEDLIKPKIADKLGKGIF